MVDVVNSGEGFLCAFTNSLAATNILVVGNKIGAAKSVGRNCALAQIMTPPVDGKKFL